MADEGKVFSKARSKRGNWASSARRNGRVSATMAAALTATGAQLDVPLRAMPGREHS
ncbi:MAG: hypothetical protein NVSMB29_02620 [Candidatus Dormibacteria bacterium]